MLLKIGMLNKTSVLHISPWKKGHNSCLDERDVLIAVYAIVHTPLFCCNTILDLLENFQIKVTFTFRLKSCLLFGDSWRDMLFSQRHALKAQDEHAHLTERHMQTECVKLCDFHLLFWRYSCSGAHKHRLHSDLAWSALALHAKAHTHTGNFAHTSHTHSHTCTHSVTLFAQPCQWNINSVDGTCFHNITIKINMAVTNLMSLHINIENAYNA